jgi:hypothetical protein
MLCVALLASVGLPTAVVGAQSEKRSDREEQREEAFRMVDAYIVANIQESLGLDEETYARIIPVVTKLQKVRRQFWEERRREEKKLRHLLRSGTATEAEVETHLTSLKALEVEGPRQIRRQMDELDALLTPLQQAKYRVFEGEVEDRLRELLRKARRDRGQP